MSAGLTADFADDTDGEKYPRRPRYPRLIKFVPEIIRAKAEDADTLTQIAHAAKRHWRYPEIWIAAWRDTLTMRPEFITTNVAYIAVEKQRPVGFYVLTKEPDSLHLDHLWILPSSMGRGVGRALFEHAAAEVNRLGLRSMKIEADPNAEGFYKRMGAVRVGMSASETCGQRRELPRLEYQLESWSAGVVE
jgi:GNAT superfamily N-acetyltransferase